jgi:hypothetical protein
MLWGIDVRKLQVFWQRRLQKQNDQDVAFCRKLVNELGFKQTKPTILWEDNNGCLSFAKSDHYKDKGPTGGPWDCPKTMV